MILTMTKMVGTYSVTSFEEYKKEARFRECQSSNAYKPIQAGKVDGRG